jgi:hypothetical protein
LIGAPYGVRLQVEVITAKAAALHLDAAVVKYRGDKIVNAFMMYRAP